jgi:hypothetical protein
VNFIEARYHAYKNKRVRHLSATDDKWVSSAWFSDQNRELAVFEVLEGWEVEPEVVTVTRAQLNEWFHWRTQQGNDCSGVRDRDWSRLKDLNK